jgi:hypothetical protein
MKLGPIVRVLFYTDSSRTDDGLAFGEEALSDVLGPDAFRLEFQASDARYIPPPNTPIVDDYQRRSDASFAALPAAPLPLSEGEVGAANDDAEEGGPPQSAETGAGARTTAGSGPSAVLAAARDPTARSLEAEASASTHEAGPEAGGSSLSLRRRDNPEQAEASADMGRAAARAHASTHPRSAGTAFGTRGRATQDAVSDGGGGAATRATVEACPLRRGDDTEALTLELSDDWAWNIHLPAAFGTEAAHFVRQQQAPQVVVSDQGEQPQALLQGAWVGETFADGLASGVAVSLGAGACLAQYSILAPQADTFAISFDECLGRCGALPSNKCRYLSYHAEDR